MNNNFLRHYGVLGMKWGVRRYQDEDGSLTPEGRRHLKKESKKMASNLNGYSTQYSLGKVYGDKESSERALKAIDSILKDAERKGYTVEYVETTREWTNGVDYVTNLPVMNFKVNNIKGNSGDFTKKA